MIARLQAHFADPLCHLGDEDPRLAGIFTPESERGLPKTGVTSQFLENATDYHRRYADPGMRVLIESLLPPAPKELSILDIGSGSGKSVIALLELYPDAYVVATDISAELLAILRDILEAKPGCAGRYGLVCMDANHDRFEPGTFDLAVGAAILHHIVDPRRVLRACAGALREGGQALFIEPFEAGHGVLRIAYRHILAEARRRRENAAGFGHLECMVVDHEARLRDKADPIFQHLDDKWYFTRSFFEKATRGPEWQACRVEPLNLDEAPLTAHARMELRLGLGADDSALPPWAWEVIREHEAFFSREAYRDMMFEGAVILQRSSAPVAPVHRPGWWWNAAQPGRGFFIDFHRGSPGIACLAYDDDGRPAWTVAGRAALHFDDEGDSIGFTHGETTLRLVPLHADHGSGGHSGWWIEESDACATSIAVEDLDGRVMAALLDPDGWSLLVGRQSGSECYAGDWLRFSGGPKIGGPYRPPREPVSLGRGQLSWTRDDRLVVDDPQRQRRTYRRLANAEPLPRAR